MPTLMCNCAALMVAGLFYAWRAYHCTRLLRERTLRERVAYMLWVMADTVETDLEPEHYPDAQLGLSTAQT